MKATNIEWDIDDESNLEFLPDEIEIPEELELLYQEDEDEGLEAISDYISDETGFCHKGFCLDD